MNARGCAFWRALFPRVVGTVVLVPFCVISLFGTAQKTTNSARRTTAASAIQVDSSAVILIASKTPEPVEKATEDLRSDFAKVFGKKPRLVTKTEEAGPVTVVIGSINDLPEAV